MSGIAVSGSALRRGVLGRPRQPATPIHGATWQATVLDAGAVQDELNRLWGEFRARRGASGGSDAVSSAAAMTRANTLNLIAVARSPAEATRIERAVGYLGDYYPARAIVLVADPTRTARSDDGLDVRVSLLEQSGGDRPATRFECVTVSAGAAAASRFASLVSSLLVPELPDFFWWPGDNLATALFQDLIDIADRLILDSGALADPIMGLRVLAAQAARPQQFPRVTDFAWTRLLPWRALVAQFFDVPEARPCLDTIDRVELTYAPQAPSGASGLTAALLTAGWLGSRLGWRVAAPLERGRVGWRAEVELPSAARAVIRLRPSYDTTYRHGLGAVDITCAPPHRGAFRIQRITPTTLTTSSETATMPRVGRMVQAEEGDEADLLGQALHTFGRDPNFEEALTFAATLLPGSLPTGNGLAAAQHS